MIIQPIKDGHCSYYKQIAKETPSILERFYKFQYFREILKISITPYRKHYEFEKRFNINEQN